MEFCIELHKKINISISFALGQMETCGTFAKK